MNLELEETKTLHREKLIKLRNSNMDNPIAGDLIQTNNYINFNTHAAIEEIIQTLPEMDHQEGT